MNRYIGTKIIHAEPAEKSGDPGYFVKYPDGYTSWSPKEVFEEAYRLCDAMPFGLAVEAMKKGYKVERKAWGGKQNLMFNPESDYHLPRLDILRADGKYYPWLAPQVDLLADDWMVVS